MQIKELKSKDLQKEFEITIPSKDISQKLNNKLLEISQTSEVEGFRKGKAPIDILKQKFNECCKYEFDKDGKLIGESNCSICKS